jgi:pyruvate dehydrogenase E2 component (dihydrolipoamide acetyltransferase)
MPIEITMPKLSDTMEEGTILRWYKREGEVVTAGELLAEVETDKADMELEAEQAGILTEIRVKEGEAAAVGAVIAILGGSPKIAETPSAGNASPAPPAPVAPGPPTQPAPAIQPAAVAASPPRTPDTRTQPAAPAKAAPPIAERAPATASPPAGRQQVSKLRLTVAKQMSAAKREMPHFYVVSEIDMSEAAKMRAALATYAAVPERITFTHLLIRALALTLRRHPRVNASWTDGAITYHEDINIGVAVALEDGLIAPVLRGCQNLSLRAIARATAELVGKAQTGRFGGDELTGATFTLSNMGMLDIEEFSAVITPPQAAILAVGAIKERAVARDGQLAIAKTMRVTLSADHRVLNGMEAGRFLEELKHILEHPVLLVFDQE